MSKDHNPLEYDRLTLEKRQVFIRGALDDACANIIIAKLLYLQMQSAETPVSLFIDSPGGSATASLAILDTIEFLTPEVHTHGLSQVNGVALWLLVTGEPGHRYIQQDSNLSIEPTRAQSSDSSVLSYLSKLNVTLAERFASKTQLTKQEVLDALATGHRFTADEAVLAGIADAKFGPGRTV